ncbi:MAG: T9SS C-terminal target domain-containing protein [Bacteroidetes bacterium]|nr:MAG: T9SS C-terminal target domain-containing protein [Bacteroidota bacterium]
MKNAKILFLFLIISIQTCFGLSISLTNAPKISKIGGMATFTGTIFPGNDTKLHIGKVNAGNPNTLSGGQFSAKLPLGSSSKNGIYLSDITFGQTVFYQNIPQLTYTGGTAGSISPNTFETQTKPLDFAPSAMVLTDYYNQGFLGIYFGNTNTALKVIYNDINTKPYKISNFFADNSFISVGQSPNKLKVSELNANGSLDIVPYTTNGNATISVIDNNFTTPYSLINTFANDYVFSDIDDDKKLDLVYISGVQIFAIKNVSTASNYSFAGTSSALLSNFYPQGFNLIPTDLDNDNRQEIVVSVNKTFSTPFSIEVFTTSSSFFTKIATITTSSAITKIENCDLNDDGFHDLVLKYGNFDSLAIVQNNSFGQTLSGSSFSDPILFTLGQGKIISDLTTGDVDGDGIQEIIVAYSQGGSSKIRVMKSNFKLNPTGNLPISANSFSTIQDYNTDAFFNDKPVLGLEVADINADGKNDIVAYGSDFIGQTTTLGMFMVLLNKSCAAPEVGILDKSFCGNSNCPKFACTGTKLNINATASGDNLTYLWEGFTENTTMAGMLENLNIQNDSRFTIISNKQLGFTSANPDIISKIIKLTVEGSCGESKTDNVTIGEVFNSPTLIQTTTVCGEPLLELRNISVSGAIFGDTYINGNMIFKDLDLPEIPSSFKPMVVGAYKMEVIMYPQDSRFSFSSGKCKTNEVLISNIEKILDFTTINNANYTSFSAPKNAGTYRWYLNERLIINQTTSGLATNYKGNYRVEFTDNSGCKSISKGVLLDNPAYFDVPNGRGDFTLSISKPEFTFQVYPNPVKDILHIDLENITEKSNVKLIDNLGNIKLDIMLLNHKNEIDISHLNSGIYIMQVFENESIFTHKLVVF